MNITNLAATAIDNLNPELYDVYEQKKEGSFLTEEEKLGLNKKSVRGVISDSVDGLLDEPDTCYLYTKDKLENGWFVDLKDEGIFKVVAKNPTSMQYTLRLENSLKSSDLTADVR